MSHEQERFGGGRDPSVVLLPRALTKAELPPMDGDPLVSHGWDLSLSFDAMLAPFKQNVPDSLAPAPRAWRGSGRGRRRPCGEGNVGIRERNAESFKIEKSIEYMLYKFYLLHWITQDEAKHTTCNMQRGTSRGGERTCRGQGIRWCRPDPKKNQIKSSESTKNASRQAIKVFLCLTFRLQGRQHPLR